MGVPENDTSKPPPYTFQPPHNPQFPPPPIGMPQAQPGAAGTQYAVYSAQPGTATVVHEQLRSRTVRLFCPHCRADVSTAVQYKTGRFTHIAAGIICLMGLICCWCIPYFMDTFKDAEHECPNCHRFIGVFRK